MTDLCLPACSLLVCFSISTCQHLFNSVEGTACFILAQGTYAWPVRGPPTHSRNISFTDCQCLHSTCGCTCAVVLRLLINHDSYFWRVTRTVCLVNHDTMHPKHTGDTPIHVCRECLLLIWCLFCHFWLHVLWLHCLNQEPSVLEPNSVFEERKVLLSYGLSGGSYSGCVVAPLQ